MINCFVCASPFVMFGFHLVHPVIQLLHECIYAVLSRMECADAVRHTEPVLIIAASGIELFEVLLHLRYLPAKIRPIAEASHATESP